MKIFKTTIIILLIPLIFNLYLPKVAFAIEAEPDVTKHPPEVSTTPEIDIPTIKEKKTSFWKTLGLLVLLGGAAAAAAGGGGGGGGGDGGSSTGSVNVSW